MEEKKSLEIRKDSSISFDKEQGHYVLTNKHVFHDAIIISVPSFLKLEAELFRVFGTAAASVLEIAGEAAGSESAKRLMNVEHTEDDIKYVFNSVSKWGYGKYELVDLNLAMGHVKFKLHNNPLAVVTDKESSGEHVKIINHHFLIGFYTGYFSALFNHRVFCTETSCMNRGDAFCEFSIQKIE
jgi:predicted hydrocarbon binding protein